MSHPLTPTKLALRRKLSLIKAKMQELEQLMLELNRHPDASEEQLRYSHRIHIDLTQRLRDIERSLAS